MPKLIIESKGIEYSPHTILLQEAALSDLFFNYDHPQYAKFAAEMDATGEQADYSHEAERETALFIDAEEFAATFANATGVKLDPASLVADYLARE